MARLTSLVLPTLSEDVSECLRRLDESLAPLDGDFEIIFVDDSSAEHRTKQRAGLASMRTRARARLINGPRAGKGAAVRDGVLEAAGSIIFTMDADLPVPLKHVGEFIRLVDDGADVVIAERPLDRHFETWQRWALSRGLLVLQRALIFDSKRFKDTQCGFKAFRAELAREIARTQVVEGGMYDLEYLFDAYQGGARIETVTVAPNKETRASRIDLWRCFRSDWIDVLRIRAKGVGAGESYRRDRETPARDVRPSPSRSSFPPGSRPPPCLAD
jgi:glycosyltransferase involved in cell wall biosynthesis